MKNKAEALFNKTVDYASTYTKSNRCKGCRKKLIKAEAWDFDGKKLRPVCADCFYKKPKKRKNNRQGS